MSRIEKGSLLTKHDVAYVMSIKSSSFSFRVSLPKSCFASLKKKWVYKVVEA